MQSEQVQHSEHSKPQQAHNHGPPKTNLIKIYTIIVCLSCFYLQTQHFREILNDKKADYMTYLTYFDVIMCLLSYFQTMRIKNTVPKLRKLENKEQQTETFFDYTYSLTRNHCDSCNNYKFPRVSHCSTCGECQYKMDHHCMWTQTCIGFRNQKSFYLFCVYMSIGVFQFWYFTIRVIFERNVPIFQLVEPGVMILWVFTAFSAFFVGLMIIMLFISHTVMGLTNFRTLDGMKTKQCCPVPFFNVNQNANTLNLFDRGEIQNMKSLFGNEWWLWWFPNAREIQNELYPQPMSPHPDPLTLMRQTSLYDVQMKYNTEMKHLHERNLLSLFVGKKMLINGHLFLLQRENSVSKEHKEHVSVSFNEIL